MARMLQARRGLYASHGLDAASPPRPGCAGQPVLASHDLNAVRPPRARVCWPRNSPFGPPYPSARVPRGPAPWPAPSLASPLPRTIHTPGAHRVAQGPGSWSVSLWARGWQRRGLWHGRRPSGRSRRAAPR